MGGGGTGRIDHRGICDYDEDVHCAKCKNPIVRGQEYHRIKNDIFCMNCDPVKK